jgi:uncharacterized SAM-binding protein YcdF (DUF218 family)
MYQLLAPILQPYTLLVLGIVSAAGWAWMRKKTRRPALVVAAILVGLLYLLSTPLAGFVALRSLEETPSLPGVKLHPRDTIVVLSGSVLKDNDAGDEARVGSDTFYRCYHAAKIYKSHGPCRVLLSGGKVDFSDPGPTLAKVMRDFVLELGVHASDVVLEEQSSTTFENASYSKDMLESGEENRIFLVTDAAHMPRAQYCFQAQGITVIPTACNYRARRLEWSVRTLLPSVDGIDAVNDVAHEWLGLIWYRLRYFGKT